MAMWNALTCPKRIRWVQGSTHGHVPAQPNDEIIITKGVSVAHVK